MFIVCVCMLVLLSTLVFAQVQRTRESCKGLRRNLGTLKRQQRQSLLPFESLSDTLPPLQQLVDDATAAGEAAGEAENVANSSAAVAAAARMTSAAH